MKWSPTLDRVSTLDEKDLSPFWTDASLELSKKSWLPIETDLQDLDLTSWSTSSNDRDQFLRCIKIQHARTATQSSETISWRSSPTSLQSTMDVENISDPTIKPIKVRFHPRPGQVKALNKCLGTHRYFWNKAKAFIEETYDAAKAQRVLDLEGGIALGCASCTPSKRCARSSLTCSLHPTVHGCDPEPKKEKHKCMAAGCTTVVSIQARYGCCKHPTAQGCEEAPPVPKCFAMTKPAYRCGKPVASDEANVGHPERYFCEEHAANGISVTAQHEGRSIWSDITVRKAVMPRDADMDATNMWQKETPFDTRSGAIRKHMAAWKSFFQRRKADPKTNPPNFLRKKSRSDTMFTFEKSAVSFNDGKLRLFPARLGGSLPLRSKDRKRVAKHFLKGEACDGEVIRTKNGRWYIVLPRKMIIEKCNPEGGIVALDPGGRTFNTMYSPDGICGKIGDGLYDEPSVQKALAKADKLMSLSAKLDVRCRRRRNVLNRAQALRTKVRDIVRDVHRKTWSFLCNNFSRIFIPPFKAPEMIGVGRRVLNNKAVRNLTTFAHSEFRNGLVSYASKRGVDVHVGSEAWTTKTCTGCGHVMDVGSRKFVDCSACNQRMDRDVSGARNIFLRNATALGIKTR